MGVFRRGKKHCAKRGDEWLGTFDTKAEADRAFAARVLRDLNPSAMPFAAFVDEWLTTLNVEPRTITDYTTTSKQLVSLIGEVPLGSITTRVVEDAVSVAVKRYKPRTVHKQVTRLRQILKSAVRRGYIASAPDTERLSLPRVQRKRITPLSQVQAHAILDAADDYWRLPMRVAMVAGLRQEELFGLTLDSPSRGALHITHKLYNGKLGALKSDAAHRSIPLPPSTYAEIRRRMKSAPGNPQGLLFPTPWGTPVNTRTWSDVMRSTAKRAGLPWVRLHDLRHCYASMLIAEGATPKVLQELLGHSTITLTYDTYGHLFPSEARSAAKAVGRRLDL